jgi:protein-tyrosine phosphatase
MDTTIGVANAHFVTPFLAVGGDLDLRDEDLAVQQTIDLVLAGITHVLDVRLELDDAQWWEEVREVSYRWAGVDDAGQRIPAAWFDEVTAWALKALEVPGAKLLTHCHMGINRGPSAAYAVLLALGWDPAEAIDAIRTARPIANVWYAEDALDWHHARSGASETAAARDRRRLADWRREHPLDVVRIIADVRRGEAS